MMIIKLTNKNTKTAIKEAIRVLESGGLVIYPTETCYGLAADATNQKAVDKLLSYKRRREGKPLSILVADQKMAEKYVDLNDSAKRFYERFLPGPVTVISKSRGCLAKGVQSEIGTLGIRISSNSFAMELVSTFGKPVTATSANASWQKKPYSIDDILKPLSLKQKDKLDLIIDAGQLPKTKSSTVVDTTLIEGMVLRRGEIDLGEKAVELVSESEEQTKNLAKTLILKHWNSLRKKGLVIGLVGDLGVGKTIFAKGIGSFLHITSEITSPSYNLVNEYEYDRNGVSGMFYHLDPWRLESFEQLEKIGLSQMIQKNNVIVIEWASKFMPELENYCHKKSVQLIKVIFEDLGESKRKINVIEEKIKVQRSS